jgi:hypothetical protein
MKGAREKDLDADGQIQAKFNQIRALFHGLKRARREYPAVEGIEWEPIPGGQVLVIRMLYPFEMLRIDLADDQITELCNRAQGLTAGGAQIATPAQQAEILGNGVLQEGS